MVYIPFMVSGALLRRIEDAVGDLFDAPPNVYTLRELRALISRHRRVWGVPSGTKTGEIVESIEALGVLEPVELTSDEYKPIRRYRTARASACELGVALRAGSFISHGTAARVHGLVSTTSNTIVINKEQSVKPRPTGGLSQEPLDRAFARPQRRSRFVYTDGTHDFLLISGKHTNRYEVTTAPTESGADVPIASVERTLVDLCVRPEYVGDTDDVLEAFRSALDRGVAPIRVHETLSKMSYLYPYHQALGFWFERAGASEASLESLRATERHFDFYVCHEIENATHDPTWRVHYPANLDR